MTITLLTQQDAIDQSVIFLQREEEWGTWWEQYPAMTPESLISPTAADLDAITGCNHWTTHMCNECHEHVPEVLAMDVKTYGGSGIWHVCRKCLETALGGAR